MKTTTKQLVTNALLLAVGFLLHYVTPAIGSMQIDFSLITLILVINLNRNSFSTCIAGGIATGIFAGITSKFPFGLVPNIVDKIITTIFVYLLLKLLDKTALNSKIKAIVVNAVGTLISWWEGEIKRINISKAVRSFSEGRSKQDICTNITTGEEKK